MTGPEASRSGCLTLFAYFALLHALYTVPLNVLLFVHTWWQLEQLVIDTSGGCGVSFDIEIASAAFEGKKLLERHRVVNAALIEELKELHALSIRKALTPEQWKNQNPETVAKA